jgi:hypothetical protein
MAKKPDIVSKSVSTTPVRPIVKIPDKEKRNGGKGKKKTFPRPTNKEAVANSETTPTWKLSPLLGGRCLDLDPVFSKDEK